jgi:hypothetical protein
VYDAELTDIAGAANEGPVVKVVAEEALEDAALVVIGGRVVGRRTAWIKL